MAGYSKIRNEVLAKALNYMRFIEEWGSGLKRVNDVLEEYGLGKVAVEDTGFAVRMNVFRSNTESKRDNPAADDSAEAPNGASNNSGTEITDGRLIKRPIKRPLKDHILETIREKPGITRPQLVSIVGNGLKGTDHFRGRE